MEFKKGDWVKIYNVVLTKDERAPQVPDDTKNVPLEMWVKGFALIDGKKGDKIEVKTITGRKAEGEVVEIEPTFTHSFGNNIPELLKIGMDLKEILFGGADNEK
ncbi:2-amino-4-oxopentanoate thiolase subunit OrtA [Helicovermis profundi]|uniref:2-amino-4-oxopentanoate thiolase subunit OrtA n=1 Tax=Helicovermis profundi TaxID=3065157 RepID=A0AAU9E8Q8_9FIRM|nr:2-amino-4-oxopentanoate thiolase subunit OrtA [Clostridia bacterium S502]